MVDITFTYECDKTFGKNTHQLTPEQTRWISFFKANTKNGCVQCITRSLVNVHTHTAWDTDSVALKQSDFDKRITNSQIHKHTNRKTSGWTRGVHNINKVINIWTFRSKPLLALFFFSHEPVENKRIKNK